MRSWTCLSKKKLPDFGYKYIQIDDSYQIGNGSCPQNWLTWNGKFPGGAEYALQKIKSAGMQGGIWVHRVHRPSDPNVFDIGKQHPDWFVHKPDGTLFMDGGFYVLNTKNKEALDGMVRPIYRELKKQGWGYVKIDGAGDLLNAYKSKNCEDHFKRINSTPEQSLRDWDIVAREELGTDIYILNCWGVGPGLNVIGLADGCRLSDDGFQPETLANHGSYEGVVWRNDPDHCDVLGCWLMDERAKMLVFGAKAPVPVRTIVRPAICSLAGSVLMTSDKAEAYKDDLNIEGMKRSSPVLPTVPGQLYDAGHGAADTWWLQEIDRPFERWSVLSRIQWAKKREKEWKFDLKGVPRQEVKFADIGLDADREYLVFEFWTQKFLGKFERLLHRAGHGREQRNAGLRHPRGTATSVGAFDHSPHLARRRRFARRALGRRQQDPFRPQRGGCRRSVRADRAFAGRIQACRRRGWGRESRDRQSGGDGNCPDRAFSDEGC